MSNIEKCLEYIARQDRLEAEEGWQVRRVAFAVADTAERRSLRDVFLHIYLRFENSLANDAENIEELRQATLAALQVLGHSKRWSDNRSSGAPIA